MRTLKSRAYPKRTVTSAGLQSRIVELLAIEPRTAYQIAELTGFSVYAVRLRLKALAALKRAHFLTIQLPRGVQYIWHQGAGPVVLPPPIESGPRVHQRTVKTYPSVNRRDSLVSALFGAAGER